MRHSLSEKAFRRFEDYIAAATKGSYIIDPLEKENIRASSFLTGIREAVLGWKTYHYPTKKWGIDCDLDRITFRLGEDEKVIAENKWADRLNKKREQEMSVVVANDKLVWQQQKEAFQTEVRLGFDRKEELLKTLEQIDKGQEPNPWKNLVLVKAANADEDEAMENIKKDFSNLESERLQEGWWRIVN